MARILTLIVLLNLLDAVVAIEFAPPIGDHMVVQHGEPWVVRGSGAAGAVRIRVRCGDQEIGTRTSPEGRFRVVFRSLPPGGPYVLEADDGRKQARIRDILVGEVWVAAGGGNMAHRVAETDVRGLGKRAPGAIRRLAMPRRATARPIAWPAATARWERGDDADRVADWSAVAFAAARSLHRKLEVPVGIIEVTHPGTPLEAWMPVSAVDDDAAFARAVAEDEAGDRRILAYYDQGGERIAAWLERLHTPGGWDPGRQPAAWNWHEAAIDPEGWGRMRLPSSYEAAGLRIDGAVWFRRAVEVPKSWADRHLIVELGAIDDVDRTWFAGVEVGATGTDVDRSWAHPRRYQIPRRLVRPGRHWLAVRVFDYGGPGGFASDAEAMRIYPRGSEQDARPLSGPWHWRIELGVPPVPGPPQDAHQQTTVIFNGMLAPLREVAYTGIWWFHGSYAAERAQSYARYLPIMFKRWRQALDRRQLPVVLVQLPHYGGDGRPDQHTWAQVRAAQAAAAAERDDVHLVVTIDLGDERAVHANDKAVLGGRLADTTLAAIYRDTGVTVHGPRFAAWEVDADSGVATVRFAHAEGLRTVDGEAPRGFHLSGEDRRWHRARAEIDGARVRLSHPEVAVPRAVRYAWTGSPRVNLVNAGGLPAAPFRTDDWDR